jgi:hypothetical protein
VIEVMGYFLYLVPMLAVVLWPVRPTRPAATLIQAEPETAS